jgi:tryptophanyl-tRNA synthetase
MECVMHTSNERCIVVLMNYFKLPSSKYANYQMILSLNGIQIKKSTIKIHIYLDHEMKYATDKIREVEVGNI